MADHYHVVDRNLALEMVRVTESAALAAARWMGRGDKNGADGAAVDAMRLVLGTVSMDGVVVIGEGEKDEAPMLYNGEHIGDGSPPEVDIAVDPLEGTTLAAKGMPSALAVIALSQRGTMFNPGPIVYMEKLAGAEDIADLLDLDRPLTKTVELVAERRGVEIGDIMIVSLERDRHTETLQAVRDLGARVRLIQHGDVSASMLAVSDRSPVDLLWGIGGTAKSARPRSTAATTSTASSPRTTSSRATTASSPRPASPTATSCRACATRARAARRPSRWSCARDRARCAASTRATTARSSARWSP